MRSLFENITIALVILCCLIVASVILFYYENYLLAVLVVVAVVAKFVRIVAIYKSMQHKINFMFNALECDDYSFKFSESTSSADDVVFNDLLNRIKELLANAKQRTIEQEKYYEYIFDELNLGVIVLNKRGNIMQANQAILDMLNVEILAHINHVTKISRPLSQAILGCVDGETCEVTISSELGEKMLSVVASIVVVNDKELKIVAISGLDSALDRKEVETWSKLTRVLTHEIMNSLSPITSLSETLLVMNRNSDIEQGLKTIVQTNKSLISFADNYRSFTTIQKPVKQPFEIKPLLENLLSLICPSDIRYSLIVEPEDTMLFADENQVLQVMVNLIKNAVQAVEGSAKKIIEVKVLIRDDENILIDVTNNGPQIAPDVVENLFTPFFTTRKGGKGIGLSVSKRIMQLHSGSLMLTSNQNSRVTFTTLFK